MRSAHPIRRRTFLHDLAKGGVAIGAIGLGACGDTEAAAVQFVHGVASGDPLADSVILWTRVSPTRTLTDVVVDWQVADVADFSRVVREGRAGTDASVDWTVKVDVDGLASNTRYWYRFWVDGHGSPVGRTRTLPVGHVSQVRLAVFSCSNYATGHFNAYAEAVRRDDLDAVVHLGDYLYEAGRNGYASGDAAAMGREVEPAHELLALADYRTRYAQYRTDVNLQALHAAAPMIAVWDDHEVVNDCWSDGAATHLSASMGAYAARKAAAQQAWHEWLPVRSGADRGSIYRSFDFGQLVSLHMLDTRHLARDRELSYADFSTTNGSFDQAGWLAAMADPGRTLLGTTQATWLQQQMSRSTATWQLLGQQVVMGRMNVPAPILFEALKPGSGVGMTAYAAIVAKAATDPTSLSASERAVLAQPAIPYNLGAWDGYPTAREQLLAAAKGLDKNLVVLSGDSHNAWANDLDDASGHAVGVEFATASVSTPGVETLLPEPPAVVEASLLKLISGLRYCAIGRRGYLLVTATPTACVANWVFVDTVKSSTYTVDASATRQVLAGAGGRRVVT
jgi:alkaline phosphatase D